MMCCTPEAWAACPDRQHCEPLAEFTEGSECAAFNTRFREQPASGARTRFDKLRALDVGGAADLLMRLTTGTESIPFCQGSPRCDELLESGDLEDWMCRDCMIGYLLSEGELP